MDMFTLVILATVLYGMAASAQYLGLREGYSWAKVSMLALGFVAIALHGLLLHQWIDLSAGQNLTIPNLFSLLMWLVALLWAWVALFRPVGALGVLVFPLCVLSLWWVLLFPAEFLIKTAAHPKTLFHILMAVLTVCVLVVAAFFAGLLALQERLLRRKHVGRLLAQLPPLESTEYLLFQVIVLGFVLLSFLLATSFYSYGSILMAHPVLLGKLFLVIMSWGLFGLLLLGRACWGWRSRPLIYVTVLGVIFLGAVYFGSGHSLRVVSIGRIF